MADRNDLQPYADFPALQEALTLVDTTYYELSAARRSGGLVDDPDTEEIKVDARVLCRHLNDHSLLEIRHRMKLLSPDARYVIDISMTYETKPEGFISEELRQEFINRLGLRLLHPYMREAALTLSRRIEAVEVMLPLLTEVPDLEQITGDVLEDFASFEP